MTLAPSQLKSCTRGHSDFLGVTVAIDANQGFEVPDLLDEIQASAKVAGVPNYIHGFQKLLKFVTKHSVCIRNNSYIHLFNLEGICWVTDPLPCAEIGVPKKWNIYWGVLRGWHDLTPNIYPSLP